MRAGVHQVVTFATEVFRGNPAFVVSLESEVPDGVLQQVAAQLKEPVLASLRSTGDGRAQLLFHTPSGRHTGAGHSMLAAAHVALGTDGRRDRFVFDLADRSECTVSREDSRIAVPWPAMPGSAVDMTNTLSAALGARASKTLDAPFGYVAIYDDPKSVEAMQPDMEAVARLERGTVIATAPGVESDIVLRAFAPKLGLPEDPVCGTAHRIIVPYWAERFKRTELHSRQLSPRGGDLWCRLDGDRVIIAGESVTFLSGSIELPGRSIGAITGM
jgi:predicted PhzF superfamily epimerase YddE/YHI9